MPTVAVHVEVARVAVGDSRRELHLGHEATVVEIPEHVLLAEGKRLADYPRRVCNGERPDHDRPFRAFLRIFDELLETAVRRDAPKVAVDCNRVRVSEPEVYRLLELVERFVRLFAVRERAREVVGPRRIVREKLRPLPRRLRHLLRVAGADRLHKLGAQQFVLRLTRRIVPNREDRKEW